MTLTITEAGYRLDPTEDSISATLRLPPTSTDRRSYRPVLPVLQKERPCGLPSGSILTALLPDLGEDREFAAVVAQACRDLGG